MICEVRSDCQFCDLWLVGFWYGGWVSGGVAVGFVGYRWVWPWVSGAFGMGHRGFTVVEVLWVFLPPGVVAGSG